MRQDNRNSQNFKPSHPFRTQSAAKCVCKNYNFRLFKSGHGRPSETSPRRFVRAEHLIVLANCKLPVARNAPYYSKYFLLVCVVRFSR